MKTRELAKMYKFIDKFRSEIPIQFNQTELLEFLFDEDIDHLISISNRTDGKSYNYIHFFILLAKKFGLKFVLLCRHYTLRQLILTTIIKIYRDKYNMSDLVVKSTDFYINVMHNDIPICIITDLNAATDLKVGSQFIADYPLIVYDEFLALSSDYLPDEYEKMELIYSSIDRTGIIPLINKPKIVYLGNAMNFDSPILAGFDLYDVMESHPINTLNTYASPDSDVNNIVMEMRRNDHANEKRNLRAFGQKNHSNTTGEFHFNKYLIPDFETKEMIRANSNSFVIMLDMQEKYGIKVTYNLMTNDILLKLCTRQEKYHYCMNMVDLDEGVKTLRESDYSRLHYKKYENGVYKFDNSFSKNMILGNEHYMSINIGKLIDIEKEKYENLSPVQKDEMQARRTYEQRTLRAIYEKFIA